MKKILFTLACLAFACMNAMAQASQVATLSHEGTISTFYGIEGLKNAYNAAADGDVITLSSGFFNAVDIAKAVTVRGAGWDADTVTLRQPTFISGNFTISEPKEATKKRQVIEGIYNNYTISYDSLVKDLHFHKCRLNNLTYKNATTSKNCFINIYQSRLAGKFSLGEDCQANCLNSLIYESYCLHAETSNFYFKNCMMWNKSELYKDVFYIKSSTLQNCIIHTTATDKSINNVNYYSYFLHSSNIATNCVCCGNSLYGTQKEGFYFYYMTNSTNKYSEGFTIFKNFKGTYADDIDFQLTDEAAAQYLGNDGTQVGMYGGELPFSTTPSNPQITKFKVATKSTADGKLSVDIEIGAGQ